MVRIIWFGMMSVVLTMSFSAGMAFETVEAENFAGDDIVFPAAVQGGGVHLLFLGIAQDQDNGTYQSAELIKWQNALADAGVNPQATRYWHFSVIENPPFFVKGLIRRGIAKEYRDLLPPEQGAVLFVDDVNQFTERANLPLDGKPTVAIYSEQDGVIKYYRGEVSAAAVSELMAVLTELLPAGT